MVSKRKAARSRAMLADSEWETTPVYYEQGPILAEDFPAPTKQSKKSSRKQSHAADITSELSALSLEDVDMSRLSRVPLLVVSIGNPGAQYANTYHSAGHTLLSRLREHAPGDWTLWSSGSLMNVSGTGVKTQYERFVSSNPTGRMVVLHDELEREVGWLGVKKGSSSAKGHNGIKSIQQKMPRGVEWYRLAIGIGRPVSRDPNDVARFVLGKMRPQDIHKIENQVDAAVDKLMGVQEDKFAG